MPLYKIRQYFAEYELEIWEQALENLELYPVISTGHCTFAFRNDPGRKTILGS